MGAEIVPGVLRPSAAERWVPCPYSFQAGQAYSEEEGEEAREGTAAHHYATETSKGVPVLVGSVAPNGVVITQEMATGGNVFVGHVAAIRQAASAQRTEGIEQKLTMHTYVHAHNEGTPDYFHLDYGRTTLDIVDFKYGHRPVEPFRNFQLSDYFAGVVEGSGLTRQDTLKWRVRLTIVQPRSFVPEGPVRTWDTTGAEVWAVVGELATAAQKAKNPNATAKTGEHCRDCTAQHACRLYTQLCGGAMDLAGRSTLGEITPDAQGAELASVTKALKRLEARKTALETQIEAKIRGGTPVRGWQLGDVVARENWTKPAEEVEAMGDMFGVNLRKPSLMTPNQARAAGIDAAVIQAYSRRPDGGKKLVPVDSKAVAKIFG